MKKSDYLIIGSGIAGLNFAVKASENASVILITKQNTFTSATQKAQGGVACVISDSDSFEKHIKDTLISGAGLCNKKNVEILVKEAPERIKELIDLGVRFTKKNSFEKEFELGIEGGHSERRILHSGDITGNEIEKVLVKKVLENKKIQVYENHTAIDLILDDKKVCRGVYVLNSQTLEIKAFFAKVVVLACGGAGKTYLYTSNPNTATGDGIAMAYRAGAKIANMEFVQFHPTCLFNPEAKSFLISEAVRGEGAILRLKNKKIFMEKYAAQKELATRDIVSRAIDNEMKTRGENFVYLDITSRSKNFLLKRFPNIYAKCLHYGIDISKDLIPVVPAAHFFCGGVLVDKDGKTSIENLYAIGETACSGVHGANRLASNSLLEGLVFSDRAYKHSLYLLENDLIEIPVKKFVNKQKDLSSSKIFIKEWEEIRLICWNYLGICRSNETILKAQKRIFLLKNEIENSFSQEKTFTTGKIELRNLAFIAEMIIRCAIERKESRGCHYTADYPFTLGVAKDTVIKIDSIV